MCSRLRTCACMSTNLDEQLSATQLVEATACIRIQKQRRRWRPRRHSLLPPAVPTWGRAYSDLLDRGALQVGAVGRKGVVGGWVTSGIVTPERCRPGSTLWVGSSSGECTP